MSVELEASAANSRPRKPGRSEGLLGELRNFMAMGESAPPKSPSHTFRLPGGKTMTLSTDRVRARPAITPQLSFMLGQNAIGLGLWGLLAPRSVNRFLGLSNSTLNTRVLFGAREMATGMTLFTDPTCTTALWGRVAGDLFDIALLSGLTRRSNPKRGNARLALGVVLAVSALDLIAAVRMSGVKRTCQQGEARR